MGSNMRSCLGAALLYLLLQISGGLAEWSICRYGFSNNDYRFSVPRSLDPGTVLGHVDFIECGQDTNVHFESTDAHFDIDTNGSVIAKDHLKLHGHKEIGVVALQGSNVLSESTVTLIKKHPHHKQAEHSHPSNSARQLKRQKRDWVIPPIYCSENERGNFPKKLIQVQSNRAAELQVFYSITGQGADSPPVGTFVMERDTGWLFVTRPLDRETIARYLTLVYAVSSNGNQVENPIEIIIAVTDQNDNRPIFILAVFLGTVIEGCKPGTPVMNVTATDADDSENTNNGIVAYFIISQDPPFPNNMMFTIDRESGLISVVSSGLDHEKWPTYTLLIKAVDQEGKGMETTGTAVITVLDANDNAPVFDPTTYSATVRENEVGTDVALLTVTDDDTPETDAWRAVYKIVKGNEGNFFGITTTPDNMGQIKTIKGLDFESKRQYVLSVVATNKANFTVSLPISTATVTVDVEDVNEAPIFVPPVKDVAVPEDLPSGQEVASYTAQDPDRVQNQKITYYIGNDPAGWLSVNPENGIITGNGQLDRESVFVKNNTYKAIILGVDNGVPPTTGTGTLQIILGDVNDNAPYLEDQNAVYCLKSQDPLSIRIIDRDLPPFTDPYRAQLSREARENWTASVVNNQFQIMPNKELPEDVYRVVVTLADSQDKINESILSIEVCQCTAEYNNCEAPKALAGGLGIPVILGILGGILALLILLLLLLLFMRKKKVVKEPLLPPDDDHRDNVYCYDEEGGGEEDQDFDLGQLHRGLDFRPDVIRNDVAPPLMPAPQYRPRPANPDEIGNFIEENLNAADNDPTAPPYDSLLVFDYEGSGSEAASLSTLNSSSSGGDQDYSPLNDWGPRFRKLADMYGGDED